LAKPFLMVRPTMLTLTPGDMENTRFEPLPLTVDRSAPRPRMVTLLVTFRGPLVNVMTLLLRLGQKLRISPSLATARACRNVPRPSSASLPTLAGQMIACAVNGVAPNSRRMETVLRSERVEVINLPVLNC